MLLIGWRHCYKNSMAVITNWLTITKYLKWQWIFSFICRFFPSSINDNTFIELYEQGGCLLRSRNCLPFVSTWVHPRFWGRFRVAHLFSFLCYVFFCNLVLSSSYVLWIQCYQCLMDCPFLIAPSVSSDVYLVQMVAVISVLQVMWTIGLISIFYVHVLS